MENLNLDKISTKITNSNYPLSLCSNSKSKPKSPHKKTSDFNSSQNNFHKTSIKIPELQTSQNSYNNNINNNLENEISLKNHININIDAMTQKIVSYSKKIKEMEKELKEKNNIIKKLHEKVDKKNEEINKLNEIIVVRNLKKNLKKKFKKN